MPAAAAVGIAGIALILVLQRWPPKVPAVLVMVVLAIASTTVFGLAGHDVSLVGVLPRGTELLLSVTAFLGVALLGVLPGIALAVALSILNVFRRAWWPYDTELGRVEGLEGYHDMHTHPDARHLPGLVIYRFDAPPFFANAKTFRELTQSPAHG